MDETYFDPTWVCSFGVVNCPICRTPRRRAGIAPTRQTIADISAAIGRGMIKVKVNSQGEISFTGPGNRAGLSDLEIYRNLTVTGGSLARAAIAKAEQLAGRPIRDPANHAKSTTGAQRRAVATNSR